MTARINESKTLVKDISCDCKCKFNTAIYHSNKKCQYKCKKYHMCKKDYSWNPSNYICENTRHLKCIVDDSVIMCDEVKNFTDSVSTNMTNSIIL